MWKPLMYFFLSTSLSCSARSTVPSSAAGSSPFSRIVGLIFLPESEGPVDSIRGESAIPARGLCFPRSWYFEAVQCQSQQSMMRNEVQIQQGCEFEMLGTQG